MRTTPSLFSRLYAAAISMVAAALLAPAPAGAFVGAPITHGPDPVAVSAGPGQPALRGRAGEGVPRAWCGPETSPHRHGNQVDNGPLRPHPAYTVAAAPPHGFAPAATPLQSDAFQASALRETSYGGAIRFDLGTSCGPQYLDITVVRMSQTRAEMSALARQPDGTFDAVSHALDRA